MMQCDRDLQAPWVGSTPWDDEDDGPEYCEECGGEIIPGEEHYGCWL